MPAETKQEKDLKEQRDRYVAFSFAAADLFLEISEDGKIIHASGAAKSLTGIDDKTLLQKNWLELFSTHEQSKMEHMREMARPGVRCGPALVALNEQVGQRLAVLYGIRMLKNTRFYLSLGVSNDFIAKIAPLVGLPGITGFLSAEDFPDAARDAFFDAKLWGQDVVMTFFDFVSADEMQKRFGEDGWGKIEKMIGEVMTQYSFGSYTAGQVGEARYSFVHDRNINIDEIKQRIAEMARASNPQISDIKIESKTVNADLKNIGRKDIARAVNHTIQEFGQKGKTSDTLTKGYEEYVSLNAQKVKELRSMIERVSFAQHFQPIVNLKTREATHYEILSKFETGDTQEWIRIGEDAGLATDYDLAVCERAINHIKFKAGNTRTKFSINISCQTMRDGESYERLKEQLVKNKNIADRLMLEITESTNLEDLPKINARLKELKREGYKVALDDFTPGTSAIQYLQELQVDYIKIDGKFTRKFSTSTRDTALLKNLAQLCQGINVEVIAESIEDKVQADMLSEMGIKFGQGNLYYPPGPKPDYIVLKN